MGVLESMRSSSDSTAMQVVMVLVVISFVFWYATPQGDTTTEVARVNGVRIMETDFRQLYSNAKKTREVQLQRALTGPEEQSLSDSVRQQLVELEVVRQEAAGLGVEVSEYEIARYIMSIPGLVGDDKKLDREAYEFHLQRQGITDAAFQERIRKELTFMKLQSLVMAGTTISEPVLRRSFEQSQRKVDITYARIRPSAFYSGIEIPAEELQTWLTENEDVVNETYEKDLERLYKHPEQLRLSMIRMAIGDGQSVADLLPRMNQIRAELMEGADFETLARKHSEHITAEKGGDMGLQPVMKLSVDVTDAVEGIGAGELSRVVTSEGDLRIYKLHERIEPKTDALEEVREKIATRLIREDRAPVLAAKFAEEELLPAWRDAGAVPTELLQSKGFASQSTGLIPVSGGGNPFGGPPPELLSAASDAEEGAVLPEVFESGGVLWVAQVSQRQEADMTQFEENRDMIRNRELLTRRQQVFGSWVADAVARADVQ